MVYILPGESYKESDLHQIHDQALKDADVALLADAWEVHTCNSKQCAAACFTVLRMCSFLLFMSVHPCACTHLNCPLCSMSINTDTMLSEMHSPTLDACTAL